MPIKDRNRRRLPRLGIIRLGYRKKNKRGKEYPVQSDCFILRDAPEIAEFHKDVEKVRELDVLLPFPDIDRNFSAFYQVWAGGVLVCQGDGEYVQYATPFTAEIDNKERTHVRNAPGDTLVSNGMAQCSFQWDGSEFAQGDLVPCPGQSADKYPHCAACRLSCLLKVMMADPALFRMGYYQIATGSKRNHDTILGTLEALPTNRISGIPFKLRMVEESNTYQDTNGQRKTGKKWFLQLEPDPEVTRELYQQAMERMLASRRDLPPALPEPSSGPIWEEEIPFDYGEPDYVADPPAPPPIAEVQADAVRAQTSEPFQWNASDAAALINWTRNVKIIPDSSTLAALGVSRISEYQGTPEDAQAQIEKWIAEESTKEPA